MFKFLKGTFMFVICGEALIDIFVEQGEAENITEFPLQACVGGSPFNVAIGMARLDQSSALLTGISTDMFGKRLTAVLDAEGVSQEFVVKKEAPTTVAFVEKDAEGIPTYSFYGEGTADTTMSLDDVNVNLESAIGIHVGSYTIVAQPTADSYLSLIKKHSGNKIISLDPNIRAIVEPDISIWQKRVEELVQLADIVKVSDEDLSLLYPNEKPETIAKRWLDTGLKFITLTRGGDGATLWSAQAQVDIKAPKVTVIDTVGAGDTFQSALLSSVSNLHKSHQGNWSDTLNASTLEAIGTYAANAAAITCSRRGADLPTKADIDKILHAI